MRGLKLLLKLMQRLANPVAPRVGAWIETIKNSVCYSGNVSHPAWVRGLKRPEGVVVSKFSVAPRVGAWIETHSVNNKMYLF